VSAVQRSLFLNAESIGIDAGKLQAVFPFWEKTGFISTNYADPALSADLPFANAGTWNNSGLGFIVNSAYYTETGSGNKYDLPSPYLSVVAEITRTITNNAWGVIFGKNSPAYLFFMRNSGELGYYTNGVYNYSDYSYITGIGRKACVAYTINNGTHKIYGGGFVKSTHISPNPANYSASIKIGQSLGAILHNLLVTNQALPPSTIALLSDNPYQLLQPVPMRSYSFASDEPTGGTLNFSGAINSLAAVLGEIKKTASLDGSATATAGITGQMSVARTLSGSITGQTDISGMLSVFRSLSGSISATADVQGEITLAGIIRLSGSIGSVADVVGALALKRTLSGTANSTAGIDGQISAIRRLSGMVDAKADIQGSVSIFTDNRISLSGNIGAMAAIEGAINVKRGVTGQVQAYADVNGQTSIKLNLRGSVDAIADVIGTLRIIGEGSLGVVIDPVLTSITKKLILTSITKKYFINSI